MMTRRTLAAFGTQQISDSLSESESKVTVLTYIPREIRIFLRNIIASLYEVLPQSWQGFTRINKCDKRNSTRIRFSLLDSFLIFTWPNSLRQEDRSWKSLYFFPKVYHLFETLRDRSLPKTNWNFCHCLLKICIALGNGKME